MKQIMDIKFYTPKEVADIISVTPKTVLTYLQTGKITGIKIGREWQVSEENIRNFLEGK